jgi:hypothetical protein
MNKRDQAIDRLYLYFKPIASHLEKMIELMEKAQVGIDDLDLSNPDERDDISLDWDSYCANLNRAVRTFDELQTAVKDEIAIRNLSK